VNRGCQKTADRSEERGPGGFSRRKRKFIYPIITFQQGEVAKGGGKRTTVTVPSITLKRLQLDRGFCLSPPLVTLKHRPEHYDEETGYGRASNTGKKGRERRERAWSASTKRKGKRCKCSSKIPDMDHEVTKGVKKGTQRSWGG